MNMRSRVLQMPTTVRNVLLLLGFAVILLTGTVDCLRCMECEDSPHPAHCDVTTRCPDGDMCNLEQYITTGGLLLFKSGCMSQLRCSASKRDTFDVPVNRSARADLITCSECCTGEFCNIEGCSETVTKQPDRGPICFSCTAQSAPDTCRDVTTCDIGHVCELTQQIDSYWKSRCSPKAQCDSLTQTSVQTGLCAMCCQGDFCNDHCVPHNVTATSTSTQPATMTSQTTSLPQTTQSTPTPTTTQPTTAMPTTTTTKATTTSPTTKITFTTSTPMSITTTPMPSTTTPMPITTTQQPTTMKITTKPSTSTTTTKLTAPTTTTPTTSKPTTETTAATTTAIKVPTHATSTTPKPTTSTIHAPAPTTTHGHHGGHTHPPHHGHTTVATTAHPATDCPLVPVDLIFVIDGSGSLGPTNFQKQLDFVANFTSQFEIGPNNTRVALIAYSTGIKHRFYLNQYLTKASVLTQIHNTHYPDGETYTDIALQHVYRDILAPQHGGHRNVSKIVIVMTDGKSTFPNKTIAQAYQLKLTPLVKVTAIGIGPNVDPVELHAIATDSNHTFQVPNFDALNTIRAELTDKTCTACKAARADICFVLDSSGSEGSYNFMKQLEFVNLIIDEFKIDVTHDGNHGARFCVVTFSNSAWLDISLDSYRTKDGLLENVPKIPYRDGETRTDFGLAKANQELKNSQGHKVVIVVTDGRSLVPNNTILQAHHLQQKNTEVISIGIGHGIDQSELTSMASGPDHVFTVTNFDQLDNIHQRVVGEICAYGVVGTRCLECVDIQHPDQCDKVTECVQGEVCYLEQHVTQGGLVQFNIGCMSPARCAGNGRRGFGEVFGLRSSREADLVTCVECCHGEFCNREGCGQTATKKPNRGPLCFECPDQSEPGTCRDITTCKTHDMCIVQHHRHSMGEMVWTTQCVPEVQCLGVMAITRQLGHCAHCCDEDFCNDKCLNITVPSGSTTTDSPTVVPTSTGSTPAPTQTQTSTPSLSTHGQQTTQMSTPASTHPPPTSTSHPPQSTTHPQIQTSTPTTAPKPTTQGTQTTTCHHHGHHKRGAHDDKCHNHNHARGDAHTTTAKPVHTTPEYLSVCRDKTIDIAFVLDSSGGQTRDDFQKQLHFITTVIDKLVDASRGLDIRLANVVYSSSSAKSEGNNHETKSEMINRILSIPYSAGETDTFTSMKKAVGSTHPMNDDEEKKVVVLTDGHSPYSDLSRDMDRFYSHRPVAILAIGIGNVDTTWLHRVGPDNVFTVPSFASLNSIADSVTADICKRDGFAHIPALIGK